MITSIRSSYTAENAGYRMTIRNQLPIKHELEEQMEHHHEQKKMCID